MTSDALQSPSNTDTPLRDQHIHGDPAQPTYGEYFAGIPNLFEYVARHHTDQQREFLEETIKRAEVLVKKPIGTDTGYPTYGSYFGNGDTIFVRNIPKYVAAFRGSGAEEALKRIIKESEELRCNPAWNNGIHDSFDRDASQYAMAYHPGGYHPGAEMQFLKRADDRAYELIAEGYSRKFGGSDACRYAAVYYAGKERQLFEYAIRTAKELPTKHIRNDPAQPTYGEYFKPTPGIFRYAALFHADGREQKFLDACIDRVENLAANPDCSKATRADLVCAAVFSPDDPKHYLSSSLDIEEYIKRTINEQRLMVDFDKAPTRSR